MPESYDVTIGAAGYLLAAGSYRRQQAGAAAPAAARRVVRQGWHGALQALDADDRRYWSGHGLRPALDGQGLAPGPLELAPLAVTGLDAAVNPRYGVLAGGRPYLAAGAGLWQLDRASGVDPLALGGATQLGGGLGAVASGLAVRDDRDLFIARSGLGLWRWTVGGSAFTQYTLAFNGVAVYAGAVWGLGSATQPTRLLLVSDLATATVDAAGWYLDSPLRSGALVRDALYVGTAGALWRVKGTVTSTFNGTVEPLVYAPGAGFDDSFTALVDYNGELYTWYAGQVVRYDASATVGGALVGTGLRADYCRGLAVAGPYLVAVVDGTPQYLDAQVWAYDGRGWFCLARKLPGGLEYGYPIPSGAYFRNADVVVSALGTNQLTGYQFRGDSTAPGLAANGEVLTGLARDGRPDEAKVWLRVGAELSTPAPGPSFTGVTVTLAYTVDGATYTDAGSATVSVAGATSLVFALPAGVVGKGLGLAYRLAGVTTGGPVLNVLWAEYRGVEAATPRRSWTFEVVASDDAVTRTGSRDPRTGQQVAASLWAAWSAGAPLAFRDIDYDLDPVTRTVRLTQLEEQVKITSDAGRWTEARLKVGLVEE